MIAEQHLKKKLSFSTLHLDLYPVGEDIAAVLYGGDQPHVGCAVLSVPRESLNGDGSASCTSSVLNVTGHKDEQLCRYVAETLCKCHGVTVVCTGGFHKDNITPEEIREVKSVISSLFS